MKRDYFEFGLIIAFLVSLCFLFTGCQMLETYKTLNDYRNFVDYMERTNEPFEVACETNYYTILMQEDRQ